MHHIAWCKSDANQVINMAPSIGTQKSQRAPTSYISMCNSRTNPNVAILSHSGNETRIAQPNGVVDQKDDNMNLPSVTISFM